MLGRLVTLIRKELLLAFRDPQSRRLLILPVLLQLLLFPFAATLEVRNATLAILNNDGGAEAQELVKRLAAARAFPTVHVATSQAALTQEVDEQRALVAVEFPADFSRRLEQGQSAPLLVIVDGRRSNSAQIALGYVQSIVQDYSDELARTAAEQVPSRIVLRNRYNPNLEYRWFLLPSLVAIITTVGSLIVTALSIAREREQGTFEQLLVSPLTPGLIMLGKTVPALLIASGQALVIALAAVFVYQVPFTGSLLALGVSMVLYALSLAGFGLFISSLCGTQQQAFLGVFTFMVPAVMLSGFVAPVENMPAFFRGLAWVDPLSHFIVILKGVFLKSYGLSLAWPNMWPLLLSTALTMSLGYWMFRRQLA
jgi:ABC-2 type transport system permease protein